MALIKKAWFFGSESKPNAQPHQTLLYENGTTSCGCNGWTRRCVDGVRTCRHVRFVEAGMADSQCLSSVEYEDGKPINSKADTVESKPKPKVS